MFICFCCIHVDYQFQDLLPSSSSHLVRCTRDHKDTYACGAGELLSQIKEQYMIGLIPFKPQWKPPHSQAVVHFLQSTNDGWKKCFDKSPSFSLTES